MLRSSFAVAILMFLSGPGLAQDAPVRVAPFEIDITPPLGTPLCDALVMPAKEIVDPLSARGIVLLTEDRPIVLCALDWVGIGNSGYDAFREALAKAAGTSVDHVCVHSLHQHDAPGCDFEADALLATHGLGGSCSILPSRARRSRDCMMPCIKQPKAQSTLRTSASAKRQSWRSHLIAAYWGPTAR